MQRIYIALSIVVTVVFIAGFQSRSNQKCGCEMIAESLKNIGEIKPGMTRKELLRFFGEEGGISSRTQKHYIYNGCGFIKVDVKFEPVGNVQDKLMESPDDRIVEISKPYLEHEIAD